MFKFLIIRRMRSAGYQIGKPTNQNETLFDKKFYLSG
ncbi:hypothetical protein FH603_5596 [Spirosoma sp. LMG 31447]|uniref:Uncharacterized protein n=1 Tax=Spirosoma utsteinense TaxID=2585773 RepID=A0ABR6WEU4_9BACT|nr:hypothetical protein [Spirosoma utsteinense]